MADERKKGRDRQREKEKRRTERENDGSKSILGLGATFVVNPKIVF